MASIRTRAGPAEPPAEARLPRRRALRRAGAAATAAAAAGLSGCGGLGAAVAALSLVAGVHTIRIADPFLHRVAEPVAQAWGPGHAGIRLRFSPLPRVQQRLMSGRLLPTAQIAPAATYDQGGDLLGISDYLGTDAHMAPLRPHLDAASFDLGRLVQQAVAPWRGAHGDVTALPLRLSQTQFYVNAGLLRALGVAAPARWSWDAMAAALDRAAARRDLVGHGPLIGGLGWGDLELWGGLVVGLGGRFGVVPAPRSPDPLLQFGPQLDVSGAAGAATAVAAFAERQGWAAQWRSDLPLDPGFGGAGFAGRYAGMLFAFYPPWDVPNEDLTYGWPEWPALGHLVPSAFPELPHPVVPAYRNFGLSLSGYSRQPRAAVQFLVWLYEPAQQRLLMDLGLPPVVDREDLRAHWARVQGAQPAATPRFDPRRYGDVLALLPPWGPQIPALMNYQMALSNALGAAPTAGGVGAALQSFASAYGDPGTELHLGPWP